LGRLQQGETLGMPHSRPMPSVGPGCHELRVRDENRNWRIMYRVDSEAILILDVFPKTSQKTPDKVIAACQRRLRAYEEAVKNAKKEGS
jgi:phage-related protein